jgi:hypothetical protein
MGSFKSSEKSWSWLRQDMFSWSCKKVGGSSGKSLWWQSGTCADSEWEHKLRRVSIEHFGIRRAE